jgi:hypothetical protein
MGRGAEGNFHRFVEASGSDLARFTRLLVAHPDDADDLLQASLLRVWQAWDRVAAATDRMSYVRRIMVNAAITWGKKRDRAVPLHPLPELLEAMESNRSTIECSWHARFELWLRASGAQWCFATTATSTTPRSPRCSGAALQPYGARSTAPSPTSELLNPPSQPDTTLHS